MKNNVMTGKTSTITDTTLYLAGAINRCSDDEARDWREWFKSSNLLSEATFLDPMKRDYRGVERSHYREIVDLDKLDIRNSDIIVVMYVKPSVGVSMEVFYAWTLGKPILIIDESHGPLSPWFLYHSTAIVETKEDAVEKILEWTC